MNIEAMTLKWLLENFPSLITSLVIAAAWIRFERFTGRVNKLEKQLKRQINVCIKQDATRAKELLGDD